MKTYKYLTAAAVVVVMVVSIATLVVSAERGDNNKKTLSKILGVPNATMSNVNRVAAWYSANGEQERVPGTGNSGLFFPRGTSTAIYSAGLIWGGLYNDGRTPSLRVNGQSYNNGTKPGAILGIRTGVAEDPAAADVRIWRIRKDYATADLRQDAAEINNKAISAVTDADIAAVRAQYAKDWNEWPWEKGAPFYDIGYLDANNILQGANNGILNWGEDLNKNGVLDQGEDANGNGELDGETPGVAGADQVLWYVCNDIGVAQPWTCPESGMEEQATIWAYDRADALGNVIFKRFRLIYKGVASTPADARIDSMYMCQWSDPDLGTYTDDLAGCDTTLSLGYIYNSTPVDGSYAQFGIAPPAGGYDFLQGPLVPGVAGQDRNRNGVDDAADYGIFNLKRVGPGFINLPMTGFIFFAAGLDIFSDPPFTYSGAVMWYQMLRGLPPRPQGPPDPSPVLDERGLPTTYMFAGDPVRGTGWLDGNRGGANNGDPRATAGPGDRRFLLTSGPFTMAVGDTQELVSAFVGGAGSDYLLSINEMKFNDTFVQTAYDSLFNLPGPPARPRVQAIGLDKRILLDWEFDSASVARTEERVVIGNYRFQGYKVYQFTDSKADPRTAVLLAQYDSINGITTVNKLVTDPLNGQRYLVGVSIGDDNGIQRTFSTTRDEIRKRPFSNGQTYYFGVSTYNLTYDSLTRLAVPSYESSPTVVAVIPEAPKPGTFYPYSIGDTVSVRNEVGLNDAPISPVIYNPTSQKGDVYHISFDTSATGSFRWSLRNNTTGTTIYSNITDLSGTTPFRVKESGFDLFVSAPPVGMRSVRDAAGNNVFGASSSNQTYAVLNASGTLNGLAGTHVKTGQNFEIRFDGTGSYAVRNGRAPFVPTAVMRVPFSVWDMGRTAADTPKQVIAYVKWDLDTSATNVWSVDTTILVQGGVPYRVFEDVSITTYPYPSTGTAAGDSAAIFPLRAAIITAGTTQNSLQCGVYRILFWDRDADNAPPPTGTTVRFNKFLELRYGDVKSVTPSRVVVNDVARAKQDVARINAFPNPYYGLNRAETDRAVRFITFNHLPQRAILRIFNLAGVLVRTIEKNDPSQFQRWDLSNNNGLPVASGIYIVYIELPDLGETKTLKVAIIQEQQFLRNY